MSSEKATAESEHLVRTSLEFIGLFIKFLSRNVQLGILKF